MSKCTVNVVAGYERGMTRLCCVIMTEFQRLWIEAGNERNQRQHIYKNKTK